VRALKSLQDKYIELEEKVKELKAEWEIRVRRAPALICPCEGRFYLETIQFKSA